MARKVRFLALLFLVVSGVLLTGCSDARYGVSQVKLKYETEIERRASLSILRRAWKDRPEEKSDEGNLYERSILNRAAYFGRRISGTETYRAACDFWMDCVTEHIARYEGDSDRFRHRRRPVLLPNQSPNQKLQQDPMLLGRTMDIAN